MILRALGWEEGVSWWWEVREAGAESPLRHIIVLGRRVQRCRHVRRRKPAVPLRASIM